MGRNPESPSPPITLCKILVCLIVGCLSAKKPRPFESTLSVECIEGRKSAAWLWYKPCHLKWFSFAPLDIFCRVLWLPIKKNFVRPFGRYLHSEPVEDFCSPVRSSRSTKSRFTMYETFTHLHNQKKAYWRELRHSFAQKILAEMGCDYVCHVRTNHTCNTVATIFIFRSAKKVLFFVVIVDTIEKF